MLPVCYYNSREFQHPAMQLDHALVQRPPLTCSRSVCQLNTSALAYRNLSQICATSSCGCGANLRATRCLAASGAAAWGGTPYRPQGSPRRPGQFAQADPTPPTPPHSSSLTNHRLADGQRSIRSNTEESVHAAPGAAEPRQDQQQLGLRPGQPVLAAAPKGHQLTPGAGTIVPSVRRPSDLPTKARQPRSVRQVSSTSRAAALSPPPPSPASSTSSFADVDTLVRAIASRALQQPSSHSTNLHHPSSHAQSGQAHPAAVPLLSHAKTATAAVLASHSASQLLAALDRLPDAASTNTPAAASFANPAADATATTTAATVAGRSEGGLGLAGVLLGLMSAIAPASPLAPLAATVAAPSLAASTTAGTSSATTTAATAAVATSPTRSDAPPSPVAQATAAAAAPMAAPSCTSEPLMGPPLPLTARGPAAAALMCAAAGVVLPPWAAGLLPPAPQAATRATTATAFTSRSPSPTTAVAAASSAPRLVLDPALEWALGVLSHRVTPVEPSAAELWLANRTLAAHLRTPMRQPATAAAAAAGAAVKRVGRRAAAEIPWPLLLPLLEAVGNRLRAPAALALLQGILLFPPTPVYTWQGPSNTHLLLFASQAVTRQLRADWWVSLPPRQREVLHVTLGALLRAALRRPESVSPSAAAGLLAVMARMRLRSPAACALLVGRITAATGTTYSSTTASRLGVAASPTATTTGPEAGQQQQRQEEQRQEEQRQEEQRQEEQRQEEQRQEEQRQEEQQDVRGQPRLSHLELQQQQEGQGQGPHQQQQEGVQLQPHGHPHAPTVRLQCVATALSALVRLRIPHEGLPRKALSRLLRHTVKFADEWTPSLAAALLVWPASMNCRPPGDFMRRYTRILLGEPQGVRHPSYNSLPYDKSNSSNGSSTSSSSSGGGVGDTVHSQPCTGSLLSRMPGRYLMAMLEALVQMYDGLPPLLVQEAPADQSPPREGPPLELTHALCGALLGRLRQLPRQQLLRLPLLLTRLGHSLGHDPAFLRTRVHGGIGAPSADWAQTYLNRAREGLQACDAVDVLLLLRGLAGGAKAAGKAAAAGRRATARRQAAVTGVVEAEAAEEEAEVASPLAVLMAGGLTEAAIQRYVALLPSAPLHHTVFVLQSLAVLWSHRSCTQIRHSSGAEQGTLAAEAAAAAAGPSSAATTAGKAHVAAVHEAVEQHHEYVVESDFRARRQADMASEREFLLQQLDEHVAKCLSYRGDVVRTHLPYNESQNVLPYGAGPHGAANGSRGGEARHGESHSRRSMAQHGGRTAGGTRVSYSSRGRAAAAGDGLGRGGASSASSARRAGTAAPAAGDAASSEPQRYSRGQLVVKLLISYAALRHAPPPHLQALLEAVLLACVPYTTSRTATYGKLHQRLQEPHQHQPHHPQYWVAGLPPAGNTTTLARPTSATAPAPLLAPAAPAPAAAAAAAASASGALPLRTADWVRVRGVYAALGLTPGGRLRVALLTLT
ncbi:hypothetical protein Agub_g5830 [Astrephomene gubernaculifera]|uniref:Uncharacterized protein n=1 Tax=Astrephomene gubernaculifera TaxID=47775 RepID=A0AAD3DNW7_9CHLO|nr:hypothetical protein Agub_g5830 [Astrephomene gubernaculifera]